MLQFYHNTYGYSNIWLLKNWLENFNEKKKHIQLESLLQVMKN